MIVSTSDMIGLSDFVRSNLTGALVHWCQSNWYVLALPCFRNGDYYSDGW